MRAIAVVVVLLGGCLDPIGAAPADDAGPTPGGKLDAPGDGKDAGVPAAVDMAGTGSGVDLATLDLTGLVNCYGATICDPTQQFCLRYHDGSQGTPGNLSAGPACFQPSTDCGTLGQNMDCGCIQADDVLGTRCQGSCVDNGNGTFDCYAQQ